MNSNYLSYLSARSLSFILFQILIIFFSNVFGGSQHLLKRDLVHCWGSLWFSFSKSRTSLLFIVGLQIFLIFFWEPNIFLIIVFFRNCRNVLGKSVLWSLTSTIIWISFLLQTPIKKMKKENSFRNENEKEWINN